jgi:hypothetical protein
MAPLPGSAIECSRLSTGITPRGERSLPISASVRLSVGSLDGGALSGAFAVDPVDETVAPRLRQILTGLVFVGRPHAETEEIRDEVRKPQRQEREHRENDGHPSECSERARAGAISFRPAPKPPVQTAIGAIEEATQTARR